MAFQLDLDFVAIKDLPAKTLEPIEAKMKIVEEQMRIRRASGGASFVLQERRILEVRAWIQL